MCESSINQLQKKIVEVANQISKNNIIKIYEKLFVIIFTKPSFDNIIVL